MSLTGHDQRLALDVNRTDVGLDAAAVGSLGTISVGRFEFHLNRSNFTQ